MAEEKNLDVDENTVSKQFTAMVMKELKASVPTALDVTDRQRMLVGGYAIAIKRAMAAAEEERKRRNKANKNHEYDNNLPVTLGNVDRERLAVDLVHFAKMGLDMTQANMLFPIPFLDKKNGCYTINLMLGYNGIRYIAEKYALCPPKAVTVEVVYSTDRFEVVKKSASNPVESYKFEVTDPFNRGEIIGAFAYLTYDVPEMNELIVMSMQAIMKRKPKYASAQFWGGDVAEWKNGKQETVHYEGWLDEMVRKTMIREAYSPKHILLDPMKIDRDYDYIKQMETEYVELATRAEIEENANSVPVEIPEQDIPRVPEAQVEEPEDAISESDIPF